MFQVHKGIVAFCSYASTYYNELLPSEKQRYDKMLQCLYGPGDNFLGGELRVVFPVSSKMVSVAVQSMVILSPS